MQKNIKHTSTKLIHVARQKRYTQGSVNPIIQRASSLVFETIADKQTAILNRANGTLFYGRRGTLTHFALQELMCELEHGTGCYLYPCGSAAISNTILAFIEQGDHLLMTGAAYEPSQNFCQQVLTRLGVTTTFYDPMLGEKIAELITENTKILFLEAPSSLTMEVADIPAIVKAARAKKPEIIIIIDNTWSGGILFNALDHDIDISIQAGTKYLVGHSDAMIGTAVANARTWDRLREQSYLMGQMVDADTAYITARGIRTLPLRLKQQGENALKIAQWLSQRPEIKAVYHPALPSCLGHQFFIRDFKGASGLFSFELTRRLTSDELTSFLEAFQLFSMAYSWGGFESLVLGFQPEEIEKIRPNIQRKLTGTLIRLHIGLEDPQDLITDLEYAFSQLQ
ncbi:cystathionine beta-lyase [Mergibacter septicus]|uniref:Cystathionine beta-lyase n=1 Tax=Mergibacter septicus TaxID=221402 RepID=A0A8D4LKM1_9PAST|nr:cystathionine beta-lyase [Mergibacter septicus]AWX16055.1 cystathionine beta-lyase [Mergibacter septicus]QDJ15308.1 cystathionine beta-lyase [Mergibacter septicus]UTU48824.1 cystathionine beta-lyase [Mergibacter septicus]WMR95546.1 cystathionine beta-lyase [Mergibacter septicus]